MSLARSLLHAWLDPLSILSTSAQTLPHPAQSNISNKIRELQEHSKSLGDGLEILSGKVCKCGEKNSNTSFAFALIKKSFIHSSSSLFLSFPQLGPAAQTISLLPYMGGNDIGQDKISKLTYFNFLLSCFRRDSHKIDSFLKVLRCRAARMQPELC